MDLFLFDFVADEKKMVIFRYRSVCGRRKSGGLLLLNEGACRDWQMVIITSGNRWQTGGQPMGEDAVADEKIKSKQSLNRLRMQQNEIR